MQQSASYLSGAWQTDRGHARIIHHAITGVALWEVASEGLDVTQARRFAIERGGKGLQAMTFIERSAMLKAVAKWLLEQKDEFYAISAQTGATRADSWVDIEGGISTLLTYAGLDNCELPDDLLWLEDELIPLSKQGGFAARHVLASKSGVAVHINTFNFPCWRMLEKLAPTWLTSMSAIIRPATATAQLTQAMVKVIIDSGLVPEGAISLICGGTSGLLDCLDSQDVVTFTGSAATGQQLRTHPNLVARSIPFTMEANSLNCCVLGEDVTPEQPEFVLFVREVVREMTVRTGQKCTVIRRIIVPHAQIDAVHEALIARLQKITVDDPTQESIKMGALANIEQRQDVQDNVNKLIAVGYEALLGGQVDLNADGAFFLPILLYCPQPDETPAVHAIEAFGPVAALMPYRDRQHALTLARASGGSLTDTLVTASGELVRELILGATRAHGRIQILNEESSVESTSHGPLLPQLVYGGPGRAGGGEKLGGLRSVKHYMQRTAVQGSPTMLAAIGQQWVRGARVNEDRIHPFCKYFEEIQPGDGLLTPHRTLTEANIVNFAYLSGDHLYTHMDKIAAAEPVFGERVAHGCFLVSAVTGLSVDAGARPVIANYGMENLYFIEPVKPGDTIQVRLICKRKTVKRRHSVDEKATGVVEWMVKIFNQHQQAVALHSILTLVARQQGDFPA